MDKNTLSNCGWTVLAVLVLSVLIALTTPFGEYMQVDVESTTAGLFDTSETASNVVGMSTQKGEIKTKTVSGSYITVNDVSSKKHNLSVNLSSDTIADFSTVTVNRLGKNLWSIPTIEIPEDKGYIVSNEIETIIPAGKYYFSCNYTGDVDQPSTHFNIHFLTKNNELAGSVAVYKQNRTLCQSVIELTEPCVKARFFSGIGASASKGYTAKISNIQIEIDATAPTTYEKYITPQTVSANSDGQVIGLTSVSPNMTLIADNNVLIECEYEKNPSIYNLSDKTIVNFGDSIVGLYDSTSISSYLSSCTDATTYNVGFSGCRMSTHPTDGYSSFSMFSLANSIVSNDFSLQDADLSKLSESTFHSRLNTLKNINFNDVDIITIAYGTNDFTGAKYLDNATNKYDTTTYAGALRYSIEKLSTAYPDLKIVICTPTYRFWIDENYNFVEDSSSKEIGGYKLTDFVQKTKAVAKEYGLFVIDNYCNSGLNRDTIKDYFGPYDATHPRAEGRKKIAEYMAKELYAQFG